MVQAISSLDMIKLRCETFRRGCAKKGFCFTTDDLRNAAEAFIDDHLPQYQVPRYFFSNLINDWRTRGLIQSDGASVKSEQPKARSRRILVWSARG
jgi:hypothetical protein